MQLKDAFHVFASLHHAYATIRLVSVKYEHETNVYLTVMRDMPLRYLTVWNLIAQLTYFSDFGLDYILGDRLPFQNLRKKLRELLYQSILFPVGLLVSSMFWTIFLYDRSLVYPAFVDDYVPVHVNHMMHTSIAVFALLELFLVPHYFQQRIRNFIVLTVFCFLYSCVYMWTYASLGIWIYPLFYHMGWPLRIAFMALSGTLLPWGLYFVGEGVGLMYWGKGSQPYANGKQR
ncbi:hypothetical protein C0J52_04986 [Blattella germanica]|nr:hypothetical protein C0J52_04986 [Blattella germanica]